MYIIWKKIQSLLFFISPQRDGMFRLRPLGCAQHDKMSMFFYKEKYLSNQTIQNKKDLFHVKQLIGFYVYNIEENLEFIVFLPPQRDGMFRLRSLGCPQHDKMSMFFLQREVHQIKLFKTKKICFT